MTRRRPTDTATAVAAVAAVAPAALLFTATAARADDGVPPKVKVEAARSPSPGGSAPDVQGATDPAPIARVVRAHSREVRRCYEDGLRKKPDLEGRVVLELHIDSKGLVSESRIKESGLASAAVEGCIVKNARQWKFPRPVGGSIVVSYPYVFKSDAPTPPPAAKSDAPAPPPPPAGK